jgi:hypothetical protein
MNGKPFFAEPMMVLLKWGGSLRLYSSDARKQEKKTISSAPILAWGKPILKSEALPLDSCVSSSVVHYFSFF